MRLYAKPSPLLVRQLLTDVGLLAWVFLWWFLGRAADAGIRALEVPVRSIADATSKTQVSFANTASSVGGIPGIGGAIRQPFETAAEGLRTLTTTVLQQVVTLENLASLVGMLVFVVPVVYLALRLLPGRVRLILEANAALAMGPGAAMIDLMALRALSTQPLRRLQNVGPDPAAGWWARDPAMIRTLAGLEYDRLGLPFPSDGTPISAATAEPDVEG
ncbi:MAG: hypothetical protein WAV45_04235 [Propionibacteriaceae bacterium]|jgi:hypothetical protein|nr:hypothetical protein [Micropruina sp.]HBX79721.1 hypothetical protein [Propionibacteriaceae bacterium]HBY23125.1 hypothetical protein [Propionibacteriaceae bacterium]